MRRKLFRVTIAAAVAAVAIFYYVAGCASVWPTSIFFLKKDPGEIAQGAKAPAFTLPDATGSKAALADLLARGNAVLVFYRGHW